MGFHVLVIEQNNVTFKLPNMNVLLKEILRFLLSKYILDMPNFNLEDHKYTQKAYDD